MVKNLLRHVLYIIINVIVVALLIQVAVRVYHTGVGFGREFMIEFIQDDTLVDALEEEESNE